MIQELGGLPRFQAIQLRRGGSQMRIRLLGTLDIIDDGGLAVGLGGPRQKRVAGCLVAAAPDCLTVDRLIDEVWGDQAPATAAHVISTYVSNLRKVLGERIITSDGRHGIDLSKDDVDAIRFVELLETGRGKLDRDPARALLLLNEAAGLWGGRPLGDLGEDSDLIRLWRGQLEELHSQAIEARTTALLNLGQYEQVIPELQSLVAAHPFREGLWGQLMLALYRSGRQTEALRAGQALRTLLREESGIEPSPAIEELEHGILIQDPELFSRAAHAPFEVPEFLTAFIGRSVEISDVVKAIETHRLVTLTGPGGIGKTRLAYEVAERLRNRFVDGVRSLDVAPISDPALLMPELARTFGIVGQTEMGPADTFAAALGSKQILLVCDNCEHLVESVANQIAELLKSVENLRVLATSRVPLHVGGEALVRVPPMSMPSEDALLDPGELLLADAIRLFVDRANSFLPAFELNQENGEGVIRVCRRLDGMPLAIEMAASRIPVLAPGQIADLLEDQLESLATSDRNVTTRHQTLRNVFEWSYNLLDGPQQTLLGELAVFAGEFELDGINAIAGASPQGIDLIDALQGLVDASLLVARPHASRAVRYRLLQTVREFALERLEAAGRLNEAFERHAEHFLDVLHEAGASSAHPAFKNWMETIEATYTDVQQALDWSLANQPRSATLRGAQALREYWHRSGKAAEAARWAPRLLEGSESAPAVLRADAYNCLSFAHTLSGRFEDAAAAGREAARLSTEAKDRGRLVTSLSYTAHAALSLGDPETMFGAAKSALEICEEISDRWRRVQPLTVLAFAEFFGTGNLYEARGLFEQALPIYRELGDLGSLVLMTLGPLCTLCLRMGDLVAAEEYGLEAVAAGGGGWQASGLACLGEVYVATGDLDKAEALERRAMAMALESGIELWFRISVRNLALIAMHRSEFEPAARLHGASLSNMPQFGMDPAVYEPIESSARQALGDQGFERLSDEGRRLSHLKILEIALGGKGRAGVEMT